VEISFYGPDILPTVSIVAQIRAQSTDHNSWPDLVHFYPQLNF